MDKNNSQSVVAPRRALISVVNGAKESLKVKNNIVSGMGPEKGKWMIHQELVLSPGACATTEFLLDSTHQLMIYSRPDSSKFLYKISGDEIENNQTVELFADSYNIVPNLLCI
jgi:hypothetical protein